MRNLLPPGPNNDDWFEAADNSALERLTERIGATPDQIESIAEVALRHMDEAEQARWDNFMQGRPIDTPPDQQ